MTPVFVLTNYKGGVGKSTSATTLAHVFLAILEKGGITNPRVLLIDTDSQGHSTLLTTRRKNYDKEDSLYTVLTADGTNAAATLAHPDDHLTEQAYYAILIFYKNLSRDLR